MGLEPSNQSVRTPPSPPVRGGGGSWYNPGRLRDQGNRHIHMVALVSLLIVTTEIVVVTAQPSISSVAAIFPNAVNKAIDTIFGDRITMCSVVVAKELTRVSVHVPHHAGHTDLNLHSATRNDVAMAIKEMGFKTHGAREFTLVNVYIT